MAEDALNLEGAEGEPIIELDEAAAVVEDGEEEVVAESEAGAEDDAGVDIVLEESDSQPGRPKKKGGYKKLLRRLNSSKEETSAAQEENKLLRIALQQKQEAEADVLPDPSQFDDGVSDPGYIAALTETITKKVTRTQAVNTPAKASVNVDLARAQEAHGERADKLNISDYADVQDVTVGILGLDTVNEIIKASPKSESVIYYLGKNPDEAEDIRDLLKTNPVQATMEIGRLEARLKVKPRAKTQPLPDPDTEVQGGTPSAAKINQFQRRLDKARAASGQTSDIKANLAIRREAAAAGVTVI